MKHWIPDREVIRNLQVIIRAVENEHIVRAQHYIWYNTEQHTTANFKNNLHPAKDAEQEAGCIVWFAVTDCRRL